MKPRKDEEWHRELAGIPLDPIDTMPLDAMIEWLRFEIDAETFDRTLPGFWFMREKDVWMPYDMGLSRRFAAKRRDEAIDKLRRLGYSLDMWAQARRWAAGLSFSRQKEELERCLARASSGTDSRGSVPR